MKNIFVSSTFLDFQEERDILRQEVMPKLNLLASEHADYISFSDLRWGIDTTEVQEEKATDIILSSCLDEIDRTRPYMIILLGDRYGYVPDQDRIRSEAERRNLHLEDFEISVTQLEIEYGAFRNHGNTNHLYFYMREPLADGEFGQEKNAETEKLEKLKERIRHSFGSQIRTYSIQDLQEKTFQEMVYQDLAEDFQLEWQQEASVSAYQREIMKQKSMVREKAAGFTALTDFASELLQQVEWGANDKIAVIGKPGSGKSTLFSFLTSVLMDNGWDVLPFLSGSTLLSTDEEEMMKTIIWELEQILEMPHFVHTNHEYTAFALKEHLNKLYDLYPETGRKLLIGVDALEQIPLYSDHIIRKFLPSGKTKNIKILVTTWNQSIVDQNDFSLYQMPILTAKDKEKIISSILRQNGKQLSASVFPYIMDHPAADNPLMLYLITNRLILMNSQDYQVINQRGGGIFSINQQLIDIIRKIPSRPEAFSRELFLFIANMFETPYIFDAMKYIAASRRGLRHDDLYALLSKEGKSFLPYQLSQFLYFIRDLFLTREDGRIDFQHQCFREAFQTEEKEMLHRQIAEHFMNLHKTDPVRAEEITYHLIQAEMKSDIICSIYDSSDREDQFASLEIFRKMQEEPHYVNDMLNEYVQKGKNRWNECYLADQYSDNWEERLHSFIHFYLIEVIQKYRSKQDHVEDGILILNEFMNWYRVCITEESELGDIKTAGLHNLSMGWQVLAELYQTDFNEVYMETALECYQNALDITTDLYEKNQAVDDAIELGNIYAGASEILFYMRGDANSETAFSLLTQATELTWKTVKENGGSISDIHNMLRHFNNLAQRMIETNDNEKIEEAIGILHDILFLAESVDTKNPLISDEIAEAYENSGDAHAAIPTNENNRQGCEDYLKAIQIIKENYLETQKVHYLDFISVLYRKLADTWRKGQDEKSYLNACLYAQEAIDYAIKGYQQRHFFLSLRNYGRALLTYAEILGEIGDEESLQKAKRTIQEALALVSVRNDEMIDKIHLFFFASLARSRGIISIRLNERTEMQDALKFIDWVKSLIDKDILEEENFDGSFANELTDMYDIGSILTITLGNTELKETGILYAKESLRIMKLLWEKEKKSVFRKRNLEVALLKVGNALLMQGKNQDKEAVEYFEQGLSLARELEEVYDSDEYKWDYSYALVRTADALRRLDNKQHLWKAKEYLEKAITIREELYFRKKQISQKSSLVAAIEILYHVYLELGMQKEAQNVTEEALQYAHQIMEEAPTLQNLLLVAGQKEHLAVCYIANGQYQKADYYYKAAITDLTEAVTDSSSFKDYSHLIKTCIYTANNAVYLNHTEDVLRYINKAVLAARQYLRYEPQGDYQIAIVDIYMAAEDILKEILRRGEREQEICQLIISMYEEAIEIYRYVDTDRQKPVYSENVSALYIGMARIQRFAGNPEKAIVYCDNCIQLSHQYEQKMGFSTVIVKNEYRSLEEKAKAYMQMNLYENALSSFRESIECANDHLERFPNEEIADVADDIQLYGRQAGEIADALGKREDHVFFISAALHYLTILQEIGLGERYKQETAEVMLSIKKYKVFEDESENINTILQEKYSDAEILIMNNDENAYDLFRTFLEEEQKVPDEEKDDVTLIYSYSAMSHLAALLNQRGDIKQAFKYMICAIKREIQLLKMPGMQVRREEIYSDLKDDFYNGVGLAMATGDEDNVREVQQLLELLQ